jgi:hypothetical protein
MKIPTHILDEIRSRLPVSRVVGRSVRLRRAGHEFVGLSPFKTERTPSFTVNDQKGFYHCFATGEHGDIFDFLMRTEGRRFGDVVAELAAIAGVAIPDPVQVAGVSTPASCADDAEAIAERQRQDEQEAADLARRTARADEVWNVGIPAAGSLVQTYLQYRGIDLDAIAGLYGYRVPPNLRFCPQLYHSRIARGDGSSAVLAPPAMLAPIVSPEGDRMAVHATWLADGGRGKAPFGPAKKMFGLKAGGSIRLSRPAPLAIIGEGIETTLSALAALARRGVRAFAMAGLDLGHIAGRGRPFSERDVGSPWLVRIRGADGDPFEWRDFVATQPADDAGGLIFPAGIETLIFLADSDGRVLAHGPAMMQRAANRAWRAGIRDVRIAPADLGIDLNDMIMA